MNSSLNIEKIRKYQDRLHKDNYNQLVNLIKNNNIFQSKIPSIGGLYAFWWIGNLDEFKEKILKCEYKLKGKQGKEELLSINFTPEWIKRSTLGNKICLYIGKSTDIRARISKHLKLKTEDIWGKINKNTGKKPNSESQLRIGIERVFNKSIHKGLIDKIAITWVELNDYNNGINRFYLEDYFIGKYFPLFNIDIER